MYIFLLFEYIYLIIFEKRDAKEEESKNLII